MIKDVTKLKHLFNFAQKKSKLIKMKKLFLLLSLVFMAFSVMQAGPVDQQKAQMLGSRFLSATAVGQRSADVQLDLVSVANDPLRGVADYYVFNVKDGDGFVIIAGDDRVKPILAYSTSGTYNPNNVADGFAYTLGVFQQEIRYVRDHHINATPDIAAEWKSLMTTGYIRQGRTPREVVGPVCQTHWHQNFPYNSQCPEDPNGNGGFVYAGCVATAMGQVMKFWDYPEHGIGSYSYYPSGYAQQTANFGETDYHFELMPLALDSTSTVDDYFYIAQFLHHLGISVDMQYGPNGSGAYSFQVPIALENYFGYTSDEEESLSFWGFPFYSNEEWIMMLKNGGLDEGLPLYYSGQDDGGAGGHAFVCDGYDENDYFHFNWGWSGRDDAWCPIGALNTTKYAFNDANSFIGHIIPQNTDYYLRADSVIDFMVAENGSLNGAFLSWENPSYNLNGDPLSSINTITIRRNNQLVATLTDAEVGATMTYQDNGLEPGLYEYAIFVANEAGISRSVYRDILVGEKCDVVFELHDGGGDGWKGAAISVTDENGQRIAVIGMDEGWDQILTLPLLRQNLNFIWNHGWFHTSEGYDTDNECSFTILDAEGNVLYTSGELEDGVFMTYENNCELDALTCYPVQNLQGEYLWYNAYEFGYQITWDKPNITTNLDHFVVYSDIAVKEAVVVPFTGATSYGYADLSGFSGNYEVSVTSVYKRDESICESEDVSLTVAVTGLEESISNIHVYPNPAQGKFTVEGTGIMIVRDLLGQILLTRKIEGFATVELPQGMYFVTLDEKTQKVVVK